MKVLLENYPYRFTENGLLNNGKPDYRIQKYSIETKRYRDMYLLDNSMQLCTAMEDVNYVRWLDPDGVPCYRRNNVVSPYQ